MGDMNIMREAKAQKVSVDGKHVYRLSRTETFEVSDINELKDMLITAQRDREGAIKQMDNLNKFIDKIDKEIFELEALISQEEAESPDKPVKIK